MAKTKKKAKGKKKDKKPTKWMATPKQYAMVKLLVNYDESKTITTMCKEVGVGRDTYYDWMKDEEYVKYVTEAREKALRSHAARVDSGLILRASKGDAEPMRIFYNRIGEIKDKRDDDSVIQVIIKSEVPRPKRKKT